MKKNIGMDAFFTKTQAAEECARALVRGPGYRSQPFTTKLVERVGEDTPNHFGGSPPPISGDETDLNIWMAILVKNGDRRKSFIA